MKRAADAPLARAATAGDIDAVFAIERRSPAAAGWTRAQLAGEISSPRALFLVAEKEGAVVGFALAWIVGQEAQILDVAVLPEERRRGVAGGLLSALFQEAVRRGCAKASLEVSAVNAAALRLYERAGLRVVGRRPKFYNDGSDAILMDRLLSDS